MLVTLKTQVCFSVARTIERKNLLRCPQTVPGIEFQLSVDPKCTLRELKTRAFKKTTVRVSQMTLVFKGRPLHKNNNNDTLDRLGIKDKSVIFMMVTIRDGGGFICQPETGEIESLLFMDFRKLEEEVVSPDQGKKLFRGMQVEGICGNMECPDVYAISVGMSNLHFRRWIPMNVWLRRFGKCSSCGHTLCGLERFSFSNCQALICGRRKNEEEIMEKNIVSTGGIRQLLSGSFEPPKGVSPTSLDFSWDFLFVYICQLGDPVPSFEDSEVFPEGAQCRLFGDIE